MRRHPAAAGGPGAACAGRVFPAAGRARDRLGTRATPGAAVCGKDGVARGELALAAREAPDLYDDHHRPRAVGRVTPHVYRPRLRGAIRKWKCGPPLLE